MAICHSVVAVVAAMARVGISVDSEGIIGTKNPHHRRRIQLSISFTR